MACELRPGDMLRWEPEPEAVNVGASLVRVDDDGHSLWFQFGPRPWHEYPTPGPTVPEAEAILAGTRPFGLPGTLRLAWRGARCD